MRRPGDKKPTPPGGRAGARARLYLEQRSAVTPTTKKTKKTTARKAKKSKKR